PGGRESERRRRRRRRERLPAWPIGERGRLRVRLADAQLGPIANSIREHSSQTKCLIGSERNPVVVRIAEVQRLELAFENIFRVGTAGSDMGGRRVFDQARCATQPYVL